MWLVIIVILVFSCQSDPTQQSEAPAIADTATSETSDAVFEISTDADPDIPWMNVRYGFMIGQEMDIYLPKNGNNFPTAAVVIVHGGGWGAGDKMDAIGMAERLHDNYENTLVVNLNYRLAKGDISATPDQIDDVERAIEFLNSNGMFNLKKIVLFAGSAGGYLGMQYAYTRDENKLISGLVCGSCIFDLSSSKFRKHVMYDVLIKRILGKDVDTISDAELKRNSPLFNIHKDVPPAIIFSGSQDEIFPGPEVRKMDSAYNSVQVEHIVVEFGMEHHELTLQRNIDEITAMVENFTKRHCTYIFANRAISLLIR